MNKRLIILSLVLILIGCKNQSDQTARSWDIPSSKNWNHHGFLNVESITYDNLNQVFYVSNGLDYKPGSNGFISKISKEGQLMDLKWVTGLNRPTGMAIYDSILYVADVNSLVQINTKNGKIINRFAEPISNSGLNDVAITKKGEVFVSASFVHSIFKLNNGVLEQWLKEPEKLKLANGICFQNDKLVVAGLDISSIDLGSKEIALLPLNPMIKDFDGISPDGQGGYFLTTVENSGLYYFNGKENIIKLLQTDAYFGDIEFNPKNNVLYAPRGEKNAAEFFISELILELGD
ncbi:hypothetical protein M3P19_13050 [Muricauda sp. 2012CJ35-5]|uniref:ATP-binding protein n=1 Tax=Flagellimonas spongiicola TaxID=2942208 RepID=A0ABT0PW36_9FLAO|nr:hypothetical protein [Allomuricauda spongiicola]MCL6274942.1 hypothetical protein [Allomuricauda spongiicola]